MGSAVKKLVENLKSRRSHVIVLCGNVFDFVPISGKNCDGVFDLLRDLSQEKFPVMARYDLFNGIRLERGNEKVEKLLGLKRDEPAPVRSKNATLNDELANMIRETSAADRGEPEPTPPAAAFRAFGRLLASGPDQGIEPTLIVLDYAQTLIPSADSGREAPAFSIALQEWARDEGIHKRGHLVVLVAGELSDLDQTALRRSGCIEIIRFDKPDESERRAFLESKGLAKEAAALLNTAAAGLSLKDIAKMIARVPSGAAADDYLDSCYALKSAVLREEYGDLMEVIQPRLGYEVIGGLENVVGKLRGIAAAMRAGRTSLVPQGILFMGLPGTGKTLLAEAFAKDAGVNFIRPLDIKSKWVGESERRMTRFINAVRDLTPVVIFVDEFDQNQSQRGQSFDGDSGTSRSLFKKMLEVMSDVTLRGRVLWLLATNRPDLIDSALKRPGRCDLRIPFMPPDEHRLADICKRALLQYPDIKAAVATWQPYASRCRGYSGADMVEVVRRAWEHACESGRGAIKDKDMIWACDDFKPQIMDSSEKARMTLSALAECSSRSLLPGNHLEITKEHCRILADAAKAPLQTVLS